MRGIPVSESALDRKIERVRLLGLANATHGHTRRSQPYSREWNSWRAMRKRCLCPTYDAFDRYGGRGIVICERWLDSFENFLADMGPRPLGKTLERVNNDKGYEPGNCEWATPQVQNSNTRTNIMLTVDGITKSLPTWAGISGLRSQLVKGRIYAGWDHKTAIFTPIKAKIPERAEARRKSIMKLREKLSASGDWKFGPKNTIKEKL